MKVIPNRERQVGYEDPSEQWREQKSPKPLRQYSPVYFGAICMQLPPRKFRRFNMCRLLLEHGVDGHRKDKGGNQVL